MSVLDRTALRALAGIVVVFGLGGCAATHVGNSWRCPLVQGSVCARVAEADPAAPVVSHPRILEAVASERVRSDTPEAKCRSGCRPFGWLRRAFSANEAERTKSRADVVATDDPAEAEAETAQDGEPLEPSESWRDTARTPEVLGRIWIAPYVDASGVYHEASWVRVVIEPAGWRKAP